MLLRLYPSTVEQAALVAAAPPARTNRLLVTHHFVIETHVPGIRPGDVDESEAAVVRPTGDGRVELVGRITLAGVPVAAPTAGAGTNYQAARVHAPAGGTVEIPDTPAGRIARQYVAAFNSGDAERLRAFIETNLLADPTRTTETRLQSLTKLWTEFGPLSIDAIHGSEPGEMILGAQTKKGAVRLTVKTSPEQPGRAASISFAYGVGGHS